MSQQMSACIRSKGGSNSSFRILERSDGQNRTKRFQLGSVVVLAVKRDKGGRKQKQILKQAVDQTTIAGTSSISQDISFKG